MSASKYADNQFLAATASSFSLMSEILADTVPRATTAIAGNPEFAVALARLEAAATDWRLGEIAIINAEAAVPGATMAFDDKLASLTRTPDVNTPSLLENWDTIIRGQVSYRGPVYCSLLPHGRRPFTRGTREERLDALDAFGVSLSRQTDKPALVALGATVTTFSAAARALRNAQTAAKSKLETLRIAQEARRIAAARALYGLIGQGMSVWNATPARVDTLWDVNLLRPSSLPLPATPFDTTWDPATRTFSTTALPPHATRLEAWRRGPGGMPELLATSAPRTTAVVIPAAITFAPGSLYQLWLTALNCKGRSAPGPVQNWTAG